jgi:hypothetical protein
MEEGVSAVALHGEDLQVTAKVPESASTVQKLNWSERQLQWQMQKLSNEHARASPKYCCA